MRDDLDRQLAERRAGASGAPATPSRTPWLPKRRGDRRGIDRVVEVRMADQDAADRSRGARVALDQRRVGQVGRRRSSARSGTRETYGSMNSETPS